MYSAHAAIGVAQGMPEGDWAMSVGLYCSIMTCRGEQAELQTASPVICAADILVPLSPQYLKLAASMYLVLLAQLYQRDAAGMVAEVSCPSMPEDGHVLAFTMLAAAIASDETRPAHVKCDSRHSQMEAHMVSWCHSEKRSSQNKQGMPAGQPVTWGWQLMHQAASSMRWLAVQQGLVHWMRQDDA